MATFPRNAWGAQPPKEQLAPLHDVPYGVIHHIGGGNAYPSNVVATLQQIQAMEQHGAYVDIAYNWGVDKDGNLWELRGDVQDGATKGFAGNSFSVLAICNAAAPDWLPTPALLAGIAACFKNAQARGVLDRHAYIDGHHFYDMKETSAPTACPSKLTDSIPEIRTLVAGPPPAPVPRVRPMYDPPIPLHPCVADLACPTGGAWTLHTDAGIASWAGAPSYGSPAGKPYFVGKVPARLELPNTVEKAAGKKLVVVTTDNSRYAYPE